MSPAIFKQTGWSLDRDVLEEMLASDLELDLANSEISLSVKCHHFGIYIADALVQSVKRWHTMFFAFS